MCGDLHVELLITRLKSDSLWPKDKLEKLLQASSEMFEAIVGRKCSCDAPGSNTHLEHDSSVLIRNAKNPHTSKRVVEELMASDAAALLYMQNGFGIVGSLGILMFVGNLV